MQGIALFFHLSANIPKGLGRHGIDLCAFSYSPDSGKTFQTELGSIILPAMNREFVVETLSKHSDLFQRAYIFGSVARGEYDEFSDVDIVFVRDTDRDFFHRVLDIMDIILELKSVDALIYTSNEFEKMRKTSGFIQTVIEEAVEVEGNQKRS